MTIYSWIHPKKGLVWCLASVNGYDVSNLKWGGNETYTEVLAELLFKSPTFLASFASTMFVSTFKHSAAGGATRLAFASPTFIRWPSTLRGSGISSRLTGRQGSPRRLAFLASRVKQLTIVKISFVWSVVKTSDVVYGLEYLQLISRRALDDVSQLLASRESVFNTSLNYVFIFRSRRSKFC